MSPWRIATAALTALLLGACASTEVDTWPPERFIAGNYQTYSWRSEPIVNTIGSRDPIYVMDPIVREETNRVLASKGYQLVEWNGEFTIDYIYAPGVVAGEMADEAYVIGVRAGVRPNINVSQAQRDNAIALGSTARETHNLVLQINDGAARKEVWRGHVTKFAENVNTSDTSATRREVSTAVSRLLRELPNAN